MGMVGAAAAFLYVGDTVYGTPRSREQTGSDMASGADGLVRASPVAGIGVGSRL